MLNFLKVIYQSPKWCPEIIARAYVRYDRAADKFFGCEVGHDNKTYREGPVIGGALAEAVRDAAKARAGVYPPYVEV